MELVKISEFRKKFEVAIHDFVVKSAVDKRDVTRIKIVDKYVACFINWKKECINDAVKLAVDVLKWRKSMNINDLSIDNIDHSVLKRGIMFSHGIAIDNTRVVYFLVRLQTKSIKAEVQRVLSLLLEKIQRQETGKHVTFLLDVSKASMNNVDLGSIKFLLDCFTTYFPDMLERIIVLEMPWIMNAIWKIVKQWMTEEQRRKTVFCSFKDLKQYIAPNNLLEYMGGEDNWTYKFPVSFDVSSSMEHDEEISLHSYSTGVEGKVQHQQQEVEASEVCTAYGDDDDYPEIIERVDCLPTVEPTMESSLVSQKSHHNSEEPYTELNIVHSRRASKTKPHPEEPTKPPPRSNRGRMEACRKVESTHHNICNFVNGINLGSLLILSPATEVAFWDENFESANGKYQSQFSLTNLNRETQVAFKIKTNSPNHYLVKPSIGYVLPGNTVTVFLYLNPGFENAVADDKFLILYQRKGDATSLREFWRTHIAKHMRYEYRLQVRFVESAKMRNCLEEKIPALPKEELLIESKSQDDVTDCFMDAAVSDQSSLVPSFEMELGRMTKELIDLKTEYISMETTVNRLRNKLRYSLLLHCFVIFLLFYIALKLSVLTSLLELGHSWQ